MSEDQRDAGMPETPEEAEAALLTHGCMQCKARQPYTVEALVNGNTIWRCRACAHVVNLIPGTYSTPEGQASGEVPT
jgi:ribosomal protein L37AE/L43A